jgi:hypothetical protein
MSSVLSAEKRSNEPFNSSQYSSFFYLKDSELPCMNAKKKRVGTKAQVIALKEKERRIATAIFLTIILLALIFSAYFAYTLLAQPSQDIIQPSLQFKPENPNPQFKAAIVDHLSLTMPNETFMEEVAAMLVKANYTVDYFSGENITVEFYRNLPAYGYKLIILRVHSSATDPQGSEAPVTLFTSERASQTKYVYEQLTDQLMAASYSAEERDKGIIYFGISPLFVTQGMKGKFQDTTIIMMGCQGLKNTIMAEAFIERGAKVYIGWNASVSESHTDIATTQLLEHLVTKKQTIEQAVENTMKEVGPDTANNSTLQYYPLEVRHQTIESKN